MTQTPIPIGVLERIGPVYHNETPAAFRDHIFADIDALGNLCMRVDTYCPHPTAWDLDEFEMQSCLLIGRADRPTWSLFYRIGRVLSRKGVVTVMTPRGRVLLETKCDNHYIFGNPEVRR